MFHFFKNRREKKELASVERKERIEKNKAAAQGKIEAATLKMFGKPCPVNSNDVCFPECVHFKRGGVYYMPPWPGCEMDDGHWICSWPKCKLWGEN